MTMLKKSIFAVATLLLMGVIGSVAAIALSDTYRVELGQYTFKIPKKYSREGSTSQRLFNTSGLDDGSRAYLLEFPAQELAEAIPGYQSMDGHYQEDITSILNVLTPVEAARYKEPGRHRDLWEATRSYRDRVVEPYSDRPWFKVYRKVEYPYSWAVTKRFPDSGEPLPENAIEFWIAHCLSGDSPVTESGIHVSCQSYEFFDDIAIDFNVSERNLHLVDEVRAYLRSKVESWKVSNDTPVK